MLSVEAPSADAVWRQLIQQLRTSGRVQEGRDQPTRELLHVGLSIDDPRQRLVFARPLNPAFAVAEVIWILAGANDVESLGWWNPRVLRLAADEGRPAFHGAYGYRLGAQPTLPAETAHLLRHDMRQGSGRPDQLRAAYEALKHDPTSRQVVLQIWDATRDMPDPYPRSRDIPCNIMSHLLVRDGRLDWLQVMRSNDLIWGLPYNIVQFTTMQEVVAGWLGLDVGSYHHVSNSLHVYRRHWQELDTADTGSAPVPHNRADLRVGSYAKWEALWARMVECALKLTRQQAPDQLLAILDRFAEMPPAYQEWVALLTAEALRRQGYAAEAETVIPKAGSFWEASWRQWADMVAGKAERSAATQQILDEQAATSDEDEGLLGVS